jgi:CheY-like chemotaxis protein
MTMETKPFQILLAEDRPEDAELVRMALKKHNVRCTLHVIRDGAKAIELINCLDSDPQAPPLDLCLVDMHLPKRGGEDVLKILRSTEHHAQTPVIVMSGINAPQVEVAAAKDAALVFFQKPLTLDEYLRLGSIVQNLLGKRPGAA